MPQWTKLVRVRVTVIATIVVGLAMGAAGLYAIQLQRDSLTDNVESAIRIRAGDVIGLLRAGQLPPELLQDDSEIAAVQVFRAGGDLVSSTPNVANAQPLAPANLPPGQERLVRVDSLTLDDEPFLILGQGVEHDGESFVVLVAGSLEPVAESVDTLRSTLWIGTPILVALVAAGTWLTVGRALAPVESMRRELDAISATDLARRVSGHGQADEIGRLAVTMNRMLGRLHESSERQARFVADAAHELRSPLASLRTQLEVDQRNDGPALLAEVIRLQAIVDDLLLLARGNIAQRPRIAVDLDDIVLDEIARLRSSDGPAIDTRAVSAGQVHGDAVLLRRVVRNVLDNAIRHAHSRVTVSLREAHDRVELAVEDDGPGIPVADRERIFERFVRLDRARARDSGGTGLGLAIAREIVEGHRGVIAVESAPGGGARFVIRIPAADPGATGQD